jgi:hypothetical protein
MAKLALYQGTASKNLNVYIVSASTSQGLTGLAFNTAGLTAYYFPEGAATAVAITLVAGSLGGWISGGFVEVDATHMPGVYQLGIPNAALSSGKSVMVVLRGAASMNETNFEIELTAVNNQDAIRGGMLALPNGPTQVKKGQALSNFQFLMTSSTDHVTPVAGLTVVAMVSIDGAALVPTTNSPTNLSNGLYNINLSSADMKGSVVTLMCAATGADTRFTGFITQP